MRAIRVLLFCCCVAASSWAQSAADGMLQEAASALGAKDWAKAEFWFKRMRAESPRDKRWGPGLLAALEGQDKTAEALRAAREMEPMFREDATHYMRTGRLLVRLQRPDAAVEEFEAALRYAKTPGETALAHDMKGDAHRMMDDPGAAVAEFRKAKAITGRASLLLALGLNGIGDDAGAREEYRNVLREQPDNPVALNNLAYSLALRGESLGEALAMIQRAMAQYPSQTQFVDTLGWVLFKLGRLAESEATMIDALRLEGGLQPVLREHLAAVMDARAVWTDPRRELRGLMDRDLAAKDVARMKELLAGLR